MSAIMVYLQPKIEGKREAKFTSRLDKIGDSFSAFLRVLNSGEERRDNREWNGIEGVEEYRKES